MKFCYLAAITLLLIAPCRADEQSALFRDAYACPERGPSSVCVYGTIPKGSQVTVLARGWKSSAQPRETFSNENEQFQNGVKTSTRLQVSTPPPKDAAMIAVLVAAPTVNERSLEEVEDQALVERIGRYIKSTKELNLAPDIRLLKTRLLRLSPTILLSEAILASPDDAPALEKELPTGCDGCEKVPMLLDGQKPVDLFKEIRSRKINVERICGGINLAFAMSGRTYVLSQAIQCESDAFSATLVHDLTEGKPRLVFKLEGGM